MCKKYSKLRWWAIALLRTSHHFQFLFVTVSVKKIKLVRNERISKRLPSVLQLKHLNNKLATPIEKQIRHLASFGIIFVYINETRSVSIKFVELLGCTFTKPECRLEIWLCLNRYFDVFFRIFNTPWFPVSTVSSDYDSTSVAFWELQDVEFRFLWEYGWMQQYFSQVVVD